MMDSRDRAVLEEMVTGCVLCSEDCCKLALEVLDPLPFRSVMAEDLHLVFYWAASRHLNGTFDGVQNPVRLGKLKPEWDFWLEGMWRPQMYDLTAFRDLCETVRDETLVGDRLLEVRRRTNESRHVRYALAYFEDMVRADPLSSPAPKRKRGILDHFKR